MRPLRLLSYLAPSIPEGLFELVAAELRSRLHLAVSLEFETRVSGPAPDSDPFAADRADIAFVCAPSYPLLKESGSPVALLPVAPIFADPRTGGQPVYFSDVVVAAAHPASRFEELAGGSWSYNDVHSRSGWQNMLARLVEIGHPGPPESFFGRLVQAGSHLRSIELVASGRADAAAIDSNTLWLARRRDPALARRLRVVESWGPMPIQPLLVRTSLEASLRDQIARALLRLHEEPSLPDRLERFGALGFRAVEESSYATVRPLGPTGARSVPAGHESAPSRPRNRVPRAPHER